MSAPEMQTHAETASARQTAAGWDALGVVPLRLSVDLALPAMSLRTLRGLQPGALLAGSTPVADDLLVTTGGAPLCWARFECPDGRMAMRIVRLA